MSEESLNVVGNLPFNESVRPSKKAQEIVSRCKSALESLTEGERGIVLGAGDNSSEWHEKGWETIDILGKVEPTYVGDANKLSEVTGKKGYYDYVYAERLSTSFEAGDPAKTIRKGSVYYEPAVGYERLLEQSNIVLKDGGGLIIRMSDFGEALHPKTNERLTIKSEDYAKLFAKHGYKSVLVLQNTEDFTDPEIRGNGVTVVWYAEKID